MKFTGDEQLEQDVDPSTLENRPAGQGMMDIGLPVQNEPAGAVHVVALFVPLPPEPPATQREAPPLDTMPMGQADPVSFVAPG